MSIFALRSNSLASSAYKNLSRTQTSLNGNISRLASGLRINKTADDSAGSNVSVRMGNQVSGMAQANRNAQDTNNLLATAESGLSDISDILGKMRELSVQASTDTLNDNDRASINLEFQALKDELTRISNATEYNGMNVLNGTHQSNNGRGQWRIQIGADNDANNQHQFSLIDSTATGLELQKSTSSLEVTSSGNVTFTDSGQSLQDPWSSNAFGITLGDVDDDGDLDAFIANWAQPNKVWINDGSGTFTDSGQSLGSSYSYAVELGDVDADGDLDAFVAGGWAANQPNKVWVNDGSGTFTDSGQSLGSSDSKGVSLGDVDGDGDLDAFVTNEKQPNKVWINDGSGTFTDSGQSLGASSSYSIGVELGDVDDDGDLDAFVTNRSNQPNQVWINDGSGTFTDSGQSLGSARSIPGLGSSSLEGSLGDVDNDGDLDAFVANETGNSANNRVWINDGTGTFTDSGQSLGSSTSIGVELGDVDNDGDLDAFVANSNRYGHVNKVYINDGNGIFTDSGQSLGSVNSQGLSLGDVDDDGDLDAVVANWGPNKVWINDGRSDVGDITLNQAEAGAYTLTYDGANTFSLSRDGGTAVDYVLTTDPASTGSSETATFNLDGNDINIELKQGYAQLDGSDFTFNVQNTTTYNANVLSVDDARTAITAIDHAIDEVNSERSYIGSEQNKLQFTMSNLSSNIQNIEASRSSIEDADFAAEAADLAKNQILAQSATAMLAQASAISQNVLGLLS